MGRLRAACRWRRPARSRRVPVERAVWGRPLMRTHGLPDRRWRRPQLGPDAAGFSLCRRSCRRSQACSIHASMPGTNCGQSPTATFRSFEIAIRCPWPPRHSGTGAGPPSGCRRVPLNELSAPTLLLARVSE